MYQPIGNIAAFERVLAGHVCELAAEIRDYDVANLIAFAQLERIENLRVLLAEATELLFRPATMCFGNAAESVIGWGTTPKLVISMEFRHLGVEAYYRMTLQDRVAAVELDHLRLPAECAAAEHLDTFDRALASARL